MLGLGLGIRFRGCAHGYRAVSERVGIEVRSKIGVRLRPWVSYDWLGIRQYETNRLPETIITRQDKRSQVGNKRRQVG